MADTFDKVKYLERTICDLRESVEQNVQICHSLLVVNNNLVQQLSMLQKDLHEERAAHDREHTISHTISNLRDSAAHHLRENILGELRNTTAAFGKELELDAVLQSREDAALQVAKALESAVRQADESALRADSALSLADVAESKLQNTKNELAEVIRGRVMKSGRRGRRSGRGK